MKSRTTDEKYLITLYELAKKTDDLHTEFSRFEIGDKIGLHPRGANTICKLLLQANFIKKTSEEGIFITEHGAKLVLRLLED